MKHIRLYTHTGGVVRFSYDMEELLSAVNSETQFTGRNIRDNVGNIDLDKMSGPDDIEFVVRSIKSAADTFDSFIPKHIKPAEFRIIVFSDQEITLTLADSGKTSRSVLEQAYEQFRNFMVNLMLQMWYQKCGLPQTAEPFGQYASGAMQNIQRVLIHSFIIGRPFGSRYPKVSLSEIARPLKGKFLGAYTTEAALADVHDDAVEKADISYIETEKDYMVYDGSEWKTLTSELEAATNLNCRDHIDFPEADQGDIFLVTKGGTIGDYEDTVYAGEVLVCISDNDNVTDPGSYHNSLKNFIVIGPVKFNQEV